MDDRFRDHEGDDQLDFWPARPKPRFDWKYLAMFLIALSLIAFGMSGGFAQEHNHPPEHAALHDEFYSKWKRPDAPDISCCGGQDCSPVEIKLEGTSLYVKSRWDGSWVLMPPEKIDRKNVSPDGQNHACLSPPTFENGVKYDGNQPLCFMYGAGT